MNDLIPDVGGIGNAIGADGIPANVYNPNEAERKFLATITRRSFPEDKIADGAMAATLILTGQVLNQDGKSVTAMLGNPEAAGSGLREGLYYANFDLNTLLGENAHWPEGRELHIVPMVRREGAEGDKKDVPIGVIFVSLPTLEAVMQHNDAAQAYVRDVIAAKMVQDALAVYRPNRIKNIDSAIAPYTIDQFITNERALNKPFNELVGRFRTTLVAKYPVLKVAMTAPIFEQVLRVKTFASGLLPQIPQQFWANMLVRMIEVAKAEQPAIVARLEQILKDRDGSSLEGLTLHADDLAGINDNA